MNKKNKKIKNLPVFAFLSLAVFGLLFFYIIGVLVQLGEKSGNGVPVNYDKQAGNVEFASYFPGCNLINEHCLSSKCDQYFLCNDKKYLICEVYDCGEDFGVGTKDENGKTNIEKKMKQDREKVIKMVNKCKGEVEIMDSVCENEKLKIQAKVTTAGDCKIEAFMAAFGGDQTETKSFASVEFSDLGNDLYTVEVDRCDNILEIIAVGEGGVSIKKIIERTVE